MRLTNLHREAFVRAVLADVPFIDYDEQMRAIIREDAINALPAAVRGIAREPLLEMFLNKEYYYGSAKTPSVMIYAPDRDFYKMSNGAAEKIRSLVELDGAQQKVRNDLREKLTASINACTTRKIALERMPEFEKYLPVDPEVGGNGRYLPAIANLVTDLAAAGWPKGKQVAEAV
jgi:hypothetical protein